MFHVHYFHHSLKRELSALYYNTVLRSFAGGMITLFTPLFFFHVGYSVIQILLFLAVSYIFFFIFVFPGAHFTVRIGHEKTIAWSTPLLLLFFIALYYLPGHHALFWISAIILGVHNGIYWVAYHSEFARVGDASSMGEEIGFLRMLVTIVGVLAPAIGGIFIDSWGFGMLFIISSLLIILSAIPVLVTPEQWKSGTVSYERISQMFLKPALRHDFIGTLASGEDAIATAVWPVFIFLIIPSFRDVGILTTLTILIGMMLYLWIGKLSNHGHRSFLIKRTGGFVLFSWLTRMLAFTPLTVFATDALYKLSTNSLSIPMTTLAYLRPKKQQLIEYTAFWMGTLALGKALAALAGAVILYYTHNLVYTFLLAAFFSIFYFAWEDRAR